MVGDPLEPIRALGAVLDALGVPWAVGGSVASSLHGVPRSTQDNMREWAAEFGITDLLERALAEAE